MHPFSPLLATKAQSMDVAEKDGFKMAENLLDSTCIPACNRPKFSNLVFSDVSCTGL
jgi:hypothetical protein